ncbi:MAG TPA: TIGR04282 family arsenosugar biosynthesis glycosyltransferase [Candidatus Binatia bacterium]
MAIHANALAVMAKAPLAGQVKTRLLPVLTAQEAAELSRSLLVDQLNQLQELDATDFYLAFASNEARSLMRELAPPCFCLLPQQGDDLGARMAAVFAKFFQMGYKNIVLIGGDLPPVPLRYFTEAYAFLEGSNQRVVLGPSRDGGYYLVGCNQPVPQIFHGMSWSHHHVLAQTRDKLARLQIDYHLLPPWFDIDTADDLRHLGSVLDAVLEKRMPNTLALLRCLDLK